MKKPIISLVCALLLMPMLSFAGGQGESTGTGAATTAAQGNEAPILAERVAAGELPPVEERLPQNPFIREVEEQIGTYGGTWNRTTLSDSPTAKPGIPSYRIADRFIWMDIHSLEIEPRIAEGWEFNEDKTAFTFFMREGLKWSDGELYDTEDIEFWWNDIITNERVSVNPPAYLFDPAGELAGFEVVDQWTFQLTFSVPYPTFISEFMMSSEGITKAPKHWLKQFHADYQDKETLDKIVDDAGFETWYELFQERYNRTSSANYPYVDKPTMFPWVVTQAPTAGPIVMERNPYYWAVDPDGNQLPYIDRVIIDFVSDQQTLNLRALAGDLECQRVLDSTIIPQLLQKGREGAFRAIARKNLANSTRMDLHFNPTHPDPAKAEIFGNPEFRKAISLAIDRAEIAQLGYGGLVEPTQIGFPEGTQWYYPKLKEAYLDQDVNKANRMLDQIGLDKRNSNGMRLMPNGEVFGFLIQPSRGDRITAESLEILVDQLKAVGIDAKMRWAQRPEYAAPGWEATAAAGHRTAPLNFPNPNKGTGLLAPYTTGGDSIYPCMWAGEWGVWFTTGGKLGVEPPTDVLATFNEIDEYHKNLRSASPDVSAMKEWADKIQDIAYENLWAIGVVAPPPAPFVVANNFKNVGDTANVRVVGPSWLPVDQFYIEGGE